MENIEKEACEYKINRILCCGEDLKSFSIVMPKEADVNERFFAYNLRYYLLKEYGYEGDVVSDGETASEYEILVGKTSRTTVTVGKNEFVIYAENGKLQLCAGDMRGYEAMHEYLTDVFLSPKNSEYNYESGYSYKGIAGAELDDGTLMATERERRLLIPST